MDRKIANERGYLIHEIAPSMLRRCVGHDYSEPGHYMVTLVIAGRCPLLGSLVGDEENAHVEMSPLGEVIYHDEIKKISMHYPMVRVWKTCIMPDHIHMILSVESPLPQGNHLGLIVRGFKAGCSRAWWHMRETTRVKARGTSSMSRTPFINDNVPAAFTAVSHSPLFEQGYNDKILVRYGQLDNWMRYLDDNPRRLLIKRLNPDLFTVVNNVEFSGHLCQAIGNRFLIDIPDKAAVIIHHDYSMDDCNRLRNQWLALGEAGGVLVGTAIAPMEKTILREAMEMGYKIILLRNNGFAPLYKPQGESFDACSRGQLLQLSPWPYSNTSKKVTRQQCLLLNELAEKIVAG